MMQVSRSWEFFNLAEFDITVCYNVLEHERRIMWVTLARLENADSKQQKSVWLQSRHLDAGQVSGCGVQRGLREVHRYCGAPAAVIDRRDRSPLRDSCGCPDAEASAKWYRMCQGG